MIRIYKLYAAIEPEPGTIYIPWFLHTDTIRMHGDLGLTQGESWFELAKWAKEHRDTSRASDMYHEEDMEKLLAAFNQKRPLSWDDLTSRAGV